MQNLQGNAHKKVVKETKPKPADSLPPDPHIIRYCRHQPLPRLKGLASNCIKKWMVDVKKKTFVEMIWLEGNLNACGSTVSISRQALSKNLRLG